MLAVAKAGDEPEGNIRILSGRGPGGFGIALKECPQPSLYVAAYRVPVRTDAWYDKGLTAFRSDVPVKPAMFARLKTTNYLSAVFMTLEAMQKHMDVALTFDANGCLTEAAIANVAVVAAWWRFIHWSGCVRWSARWRPRRWSLPKRSCPWRSAPSRRPSWIPSGR